MSKATIPSANSFPHPFNMSDDCLTTSNFFINKPVYFHEYTANERWKCNLNNIIQLLPLQKPIFADVDIKTCAFFIPYRTIMRDWTAFIDNTITKNNAVFKVPYMRLSQLAVMFCNTDCAQWTKLDLAVSGDKTNFNSTKFDFVIPQDSNDTDTSHTYVLCANLTKKGRVIYDILLGLGYNLSFSELTYHVTAFSSIDVTTLTGVTFQWKWSENDPDHEDEDVSILPIMAYSKMVLDWWTNSQYSNLINAIEATLETYGYVTSNPAPRSAAEIYTLFNYIYYTYYPSDALVDSWEDPLDVNSSAPMASGITFKDPTWPQDNESIVNDGVDTGSNLYPPSGALGYDSFGSPSITSYLTLALQKVSAFCRRTQIAGARVIDRYLANFGAKLDETQTNRCYCIASHSQRIGVSKITAVADTSIVGSTQGMPLGDYAGDAQSSTQLSLNWSSNEYGCIIIVNYITPYIKYYEALRPHTQHLYQTDFMQGNWDGLGCKAVGARNVFNSGTSPVYGATLNQAVNRYTPTPSNPKVFSFLPQYWDYKTNPYSVVSGFFRLNSKNTGLEAWNLFRMIDPNLLGTNNWKKGEYFTIGITDASQYNRIFNDTTEDTDKFIIAYHFDVQIELEAMPLYDDLLLQDFDSEHKKKQELRVNGTSLR